MSGSAKWRITCRSRKANAGSSPRRHATSMPPGAARSSRRFARTCCCPPTWRAGARWYSGPRRRWTNPRWRACARRVPSSSARRPMRPPRNGGNLDAIVDAVKAATGAKGQALWKPLRLALTGATEGPELAPLLKAMPETSIHRSLESLRRMIRIHNSLTGEKQELTARRARPRAHVQLRHDRLRLLPRRQRPHAGGVRHGEPLPAASRIARHLRAQHHRRRRQDHQSRPRDGRRLARARGEIHRRHVRGSRHAGLPAPGEGAQGLGIHR